jgi:subtilisin family serine protease
VIPDIKVRVADTQTNATWGIDRIDQPALPLSEHASRPGRVTAHVIDTASAPRTEFGGPAVDGLPRWTIAPAADCNGHGTHVAGTIGGNTTVSPSP